MVKALLTTLNAPDVAVRFLPPMRLIFKSAKVAIPVPSVVWVTVPPKTPVPVERVKVTFCPLIGLPNVSVSKAVTAGAMVAPATALLGCWLKLILAGEFAVIMKALLTTLNPPAVAVRFLLPTRLTVKSMNEAVPANPVVWVSVPDKTPVPVVRVTVTF